MLHTQENSSPIICSKTSTKAVQSLRSLIVSTLLLTSNMAHANPAQTEGGKNEKEVAAMVIDILEAGKEKIKAKYPTYNEETFNKIVGLIALGKAEQATIRGLAESFPNMSEDYKKLIEYANILRERDSKRGGNTPNPGAKPGIETSPADTAMDLLTTLAKSSQKKGTFKLNKEANSLEIEVDAGSDGFLIDTIEIKDEGEFEFLLEKEIPKGAMFWILLNKQNKKGINIEPETRIKEGDIITIPQGGAKIKIELKFVSAGAVPVEGKGVKAYIKQLKLKKKEPLKK